jgi:hypothetical protein
MILPLYLFKRKQTMNHIPDEKQMEELLEHLTPHTSRRLDRRLASAPWTTQAIHRRRYISIGTFAILAISLVFAATPQGHAFAQDVLLFFTRTESDNFYQPVSDLTFEDTTAFHELCGLSYNPTCSVEQVRSMVDFEVKEPAILPPGMYFEGATGGPDFIELAYLHEDTDRLGGEMSVGVEAIGRPSDVGTGIIAKSAHVEQVQIGNLPGEYYTGGLFQDEQGNVTWQPDFPAATLRWEDNGSTYTLIYFGKRYPLGKEDLVRVAESMTTEPVAK